jgi:hypothetical protein
MRKQILIIITVLIGITALGQQKVIQLYNGATPGSSFIFKIS